MDIGGRRERGVDIGGRREGWAQGVGGGAVDIGGRRERGVDIGVGGREGWA